jgi:hypothetical protein
MCLLPFLLPQVPFIGWTSELPLLGQQLFSFLQGISGATATLLFRRTGQQFFMEDGKQQQQALAASSSASLAGGSSSNGSSSSSGDLPVLLQLTQDCPDRGLFFYSALASFQTRTCYANTGRGRRQAALGGSAVHIAALQLLSQTTGAY